MFCQSASPTTESATLVSFSQGYYVKIQQTKTVWNYLYYHFYLSKTYRLQLLVPHIHNLLQTTQSLDFPLFVYRVETRTIVPYYYIIMYQQMY